MNIVFLGLSLSSSWGNGHATTYRGLLLALHARGHQVLFLERDQAWYAANRDLPKPAFCPIGYYKSFDELVRRYARKIRTADCVVLGSYVPEGTRIGEWLARQAQGVLAFYDIDTPVTLAQLQAGDCPYLSPRLIPQFDLYFSFSGGPVLNVLEDEFGARQAVPLYCSADPSLYAPAADEPTWSLGYLGTYSTDRQPALETLLLKPARHLPTQRFAVVGPQYPATLSWPENVERQEHLDPARHSAFYRAQRFTPEHHAPGHGPRRLLAQCPALRSGGLRRSHYHRRMERAGDILYAGRRNSRGPVQRRRRKLPARRVGDRAAAHRPAGPRTLPAGAHAHAARGRDGEMGPARLAGVHSTQVPLPGGRSMNRKIRVAIIGVGNCASSLVQGVRFYRNARAGEAVPGLMHVLLGGYHPRDIEFSAAFDVNRDKVGRDLSAAIFAKPNNTIRFTTVPKLQVPVQQGRLLDGMGKYVKDIVPRAEGEPVDVARILRETGTDVVVSYLPVGSEKATRWYVGQVLQAGCALVNCIPVFIASRKEWRRKFEQRGLPIIGDDIKSQVGATIVHRVLTDLFRKRGVRLDRTYQLNFGGNTDFMNMLERERLESKKISKTRAVTSQLDRPLSDENVHVGPSDYVPWLHDRKWCYVRMEGTTFGNVPLHCELKLEVWDSPNSAGVVMDAIRCAKLALDRGIGGALAAPSAYFMKSPPKQFTDDEARRMLEEFIENVDPPETAGANLERRPPSRRHRGRP